MINTIILYFYAILYSIVALPFILYAKIFKKEELIFKILTYFAKSTLFLLRIKIEYSGDFDLTTYNNNALYVANHQSMFDSFFTYLTVPNPKGYYIANEFTFFSKVPIYSYVFEVIKPVYIDRTSIRDAVKSNSAGTKILQSDYNLIIFPEGQITKFIDSDSSVVGPFHSGSFKPAKTLNKDIIPITIIGSDQVFPELSMFSKIKSGTVKVHFHTPITSDIYQDIDTTEIADLAHDKISQYIINMDKDTN